MLKQYAGLGRPQERLNCWVLYNSCEARDEYLCTDTNTVNYRTKHQSYEH